MGLNSNLVSLIFSNQGAWVILYSITSFNPVVLHAWINTSNIKYSTFNKHIKASWASAKFQYRLLPLNPAWIDLHCDSGLSWRWSVKVIRLIWPDEILMHTSVVACWLAYPSVLASNFVTMFVLAVSHIWGVKKVPLPFSSVNLNRFIFNYIFIVVPHLQLVSSTFIFAVFSRVLTFSLCECVCSSRGSRSAPRWRADW